MRGPLGALLLLAAVGAYAEYLLRAASPEWDNVAIGDADGDAGSGGSGLALLEGGGELRLQGGAGPGFSGSGSGSGSGAPFITVNML